ncbi:hypothetical protein TWF569_011555 [Orbilia oligospora]|nr:hypothetical protein TWF569_011555 [Orbilia oligospora]KAF3133123.1 hypothetical protein TWF594_009337 [Orbilia oligospora]
MFGLSSQGRLKAVKKFSTPSAFCDPTSISVPAPVPRACGSHPLFIRSFLLLKGKNRRRGSCAVLRVDGSGDSRPATRQRVDNGGMGSFGKRQHWKQTFKNRNGREG